MFNLFKKQTILTTPTSILTKKSNSKYPEIVEDIHHEFLTAGDKILAAAKQVLDECNKKSLEKGKRLAAIGFKNVPEAVEAFEIDKKISLTKEIADMVLYYQINYPNNKFITEEQVGKICEKYGLICGAIGKYKGFVPENKLKEIEKFKLKEKDLERMTLILENEDEKIIGKIYWENLTKRGQNYMSSTNALDYFYINGISEGSELCSPTINALYAGIPYLRAVKIDNQGMQICAPKKDMVTKGMRLVGYHLMKEIPDPVVLQPVKAGYLIVTAWGDEASDENIVNQQMN